MSEKGLAGASKFALGEELETMEKSWAQVVAEQAEARAEARVEARTLRSALERMLASRFGSVPAEIEGAIRGADARTLDGWFTRALAATTLDEIGIRN